MDYTHTYIQPINRSYIEVACILLLQSFVIFSVMFLVRTGFFYDNGRLIRILDVFSSIYV
jgi:hypothetical protein